MRQPNDDLNIGGKKYVIVRNVYASERNRSWFYQAIESGLNRPVGIKEVQRDSRHLEEAMAEAQVIAALPHERIPNVLNYGTNGNSVFLILDWLEGVSLREYLETAAPATSRESYRQAIRIGTDLCRLLDQVHKKGYRHRDLKPENVILKGGHPYLIDYGISAAHRIAGEGTERYCAPEQYDERALREQMGPQVDIYALGLILFELLTGGLPHLRVKNGEWDRPEPPTELNPALPLAVDAVLSRAIAYQPGHRFPDATHFRYALERLVNLDIRAVGREPDSETAVPEHEPTGEAVPCLRPQGATPFLDLRGLYNERLADFGMPRKVEPVLGQPLSGQGRAGRKG